MNDVKIKVSFTGYFASSIIEKLEEYRTDYEDNKIGAFKLIPIILAGQYTVTLLIAPLMIETIVRLSLAQIAIFFTYSPHEATVKCIDENISLPLQYSAGVCSVMLMTSLLFLMANLHNLSMEQYMDRMDTYAKQAKDQA